MKIGIDAHNLEGNRTGVGRVLINILQQWNNFDLPAGLEFILYFKKEIPDDLKLTKPNFKFKLLKLPFNIQSNALFKQYLLWLAAKKDKLSLLFCPDYVGPVLYNGKIAVILHDISYQARPEIYNWPSVWDKILLKWFSKISARKAQIIFTPLEFTRQEVIKHYQVNPEKVFSIPWGVSQDFKKIEQGLDEIKEKYQIKDKFILYVGSIFDRRHLPEAVKAFEKIANKLPNYQFLVVGHNYTNQKLFGRALLRQNYLKGKDLVTLYNAADLFIYLSDYEGFGLPVLEAMACGTPVVTSSKTSIPEVAGKAAIYIKDNSNVEEIARAIYIGLTDQKLRRELIVRGLEQVNKFSWQKSARQYLDVLVNGRVK